MALLKTDDGAGLYYEDFGHGEKTIVFVHGYMDSSVSFHPVARHLEDRYRIVLYDLRAHGRSEVPRDGYTMKRYARDLKNLIDYLGLSHICLIGYSMGVHIVLSYIRQFGERLIDKLILTVMSPRIITDKDYSLGMYGHFPLEDAIKVVAFANDSFPAYCEAGRKSNPALLERYEGLRRYYEEAEKLDPGAMVRLQIAMLEGDYWPVLDSITRPTLLITAENDIYPVRAYEEQKKRIKNAKLVLLQSCGHMLEVECPERYAAEIGEFLG